MHLRFFCACVMACCAAGLRAEIGLDDSYEKVIAEMGQPTGKAQAGDAVILRYPNGNIRLKGGKVIAMNMKSDAATALPTEKPARTAVASPSPAPEVPIQGVSWRTDYRAALTEAKEQNRHVFLFFTGSDWCGWCKRLNREILSTPEFAKYASEKLVLVEIDFPRQKAQSADLKKQNATLQHIFQIEGYPTVIVLDKAGKAVGRLGYQEGGPAPFIKELKRL